MRRFRHDPKRAVIDCLINKSKVLALIGSTGDAMNVMHEGLVIAAASDDRRLMVDCLSQVNDVYNDTAKYKELDRSARRCLALSREIGYDEGVASCYSYLGIASDNFGKYRLAIEYYNKSAEIRLASGNYRDYTTCIENIGVSHYSLGEYQKAEEKYQQALTVTERTGEIGTRSHLLQNIASVRLQRGAYQDALSLLSQAMAINAQIGDRCSQAFTMHELGYIEHVLGNDETALRCLRDSERIKEETGEMWSQACSLNLLARISIERGSLEEASQYLDKGDRTAVLVGSVDVFCRLAVARAELALARGDVEQAISSTNRAMELADQAGLKNGRAEAGLLWARINAASGNHDDAAPRFREALALFQELHNLLDQGIVKYYHGHSMNQTGRTGEAKELLREAAEIFRGIGAATWLQRAEQALAALAPAS